MKKIIMLFILMGNLAFASDFMNEWTKAVEYCHDRNYVDAEIYFTKSIEESFEEEKETHPHLFVDRGRLYLLLNRYDEALEDLNIALKNENLKNDDLYRAVVSRISAYVNLGRIDEAMEDYEKLRPLFPKIEHTDDAIIIRNIPDCDCYKQITTAFFVSSGICKSESDVRILDSGIMIAKINKCECGCGSNPYLSNDKITNCKYGCDKVAFAANLWCMSFFKTTRCQIGCTVAVEAIKDGCRWCCSTGSVYDKCIQPFNYILETMGNVCDPAWD